METEVKKVQKGKTIPTMATFAQVKDAKDICLKAFGNCRKEENAAFFIINDCSHSSVPILMSNRQVLADWIQGYICIALVGEVFGFPILQSPPDVAQIFRTCQLHTAW